MAAYFSLLTYKDENTIKDFCNKYNCELSIFENGEHFFHTEEQLEYYKNWLDRIIKKTYSFE